MPVIILPFVLTWENHYFFFISNLSSGNSLNFHKQVNYPLEQEKYYSEQVKM